MPPAPASIIQQCPGVWRGRSTRRGMATIATGHGALDRRLPGQGWPLGALTELLIEGYGSGEFGLLMPAMARLSTQGQWVVLLDPPWVPYPPAMHGHGVALDRVMMVRTGSPQESLWACEQVLRDIRGGAVLAWCDNPGFTRLRRLQLAARHGLKAAFLFRPTAAARQASPASLRLGLQPGADGLNVTILKCQGRRPAEPVTVRHSPHVPGMTRPPVTAGAGRSASKAPLPGNAGVAAGSPAHAY